MEAKSQGSTSVLNSEYSKRPEKVGIKGHNVDFFRGTLYELNTEFLSSLLQKESLSKKNPKRHKESVTIESKQIRPVMFPENEPINGH